MKASARSVPEAKLSSVVQPYSCGWAKNRMAIMAIEKGSVPASASGTRRNATLQIEPVV